MTTLGSNPAHEEKFIAQPFVCGAIGDDPDGHFARLMAVSPTPVTVLHSANGLQFAASKGRGLERARGGWTWGRYVARDTKAKNARDASDQLGLAGFWADGDSGTVHTDWLGIQDIFVRKIGQTNFWGSSDIRWG